MRVSSINNQTYGSIFKKIKEKITVSKDKTQPIKNPINQETESDIFYIDTIPKTRTLDDIKKIREYVLNGEIDKAQEKYGISPFLLNEIYHELSAEKIYDAYKTQKTIQLNQACRAVSASHLARLNEPYLAMEIDKTISGNYEGETNGIDCEVIPSKKDLAYKIAKALCLNGDFDAVVENYPQCEDLIKYF